ncbi:MAG: MATE family efflux transporter [Luteitalea sp.]|nr:MATE family efflux transporter [Luteitalea sp.]
MCARIRISIRMATPPTIVRSSSAATRTRRRRATMSTSATRGSCRFTGRSGPKCSPSSRTCSTRSRQRRLIASWPQTPRARRWCRCRTAAMASRPPAATSHASSSSDSKCISNDESRLALMADSVASRRFDRTIVEGSLAHAVWRLAWPSMLQHVIGGLQGLVDHVMIGHFVGYTGNAAVGVSWQIWLVVIVFVSSLISGMAVLVARFAGAGDTATVDRVVYQAFLTSVVLAVGVLAPIGYVASPWLLAFVNATPEVQREALPYLRIMLGSSVGMLMFFMMGGALRPAGDARTPLRLGVVLTVLNIVLNVILIGGVGPIPPMGTTGAALGTVLASSIVGAVCIGLLFSGRLPVRFTWQMRWRPDWEIIRALFRFGLPTGFQGIAMNVGGVLLLHYIGSLSQSAEAQAAYTIGYGQLFVFITWTSMGLMTATATVVGHNLGAGRPERAMAAAHVAARLGLGVALLVGSAFVAVPHVLLGLFGMQGAAVISLGVQLLRFLAISGPFVTVALVYTGGLQGSGDTRSPFYISVVSQVFIPLGLCATLGAVKGLEPVDIWTAIVLGHITRSLLSVVRFRQGKWRHIAVDISPATS